MGIETGLIAAGMSAATASAVTTGLITAGIGAVASAALAPKTPKPGPKSITAADKPPAELKAPDQKALLEKNSVAAMGALAGNSSTLLSGSGGVSSSSLNLGASTLLGQ